VEERDLRGIHSSRSGGDNDINGGDDTNFSRGFNFIFFNNRF